MTLTLTWPLLRSRASFWSAPAPTRTHPFGSGYRRNKVIMLPVKSQCKINLAPASDNKTYPATFFNIFIENNFLCSSIQIYVVIVQKLVIFAGQCFLVHALKHWRIKKTPIVPSSADRPLSCSLLLLLSYWTRISWNFWDIFSSYSQKKSYLNLWQNLHLSFKFLVKCVLYR